MPVLSLVPLPPVEELHVTGRDLAWQRLHHAEANEHRERQKLAALGDPPVRPMVPVATPIVAACGLSLTFAVTLHDLVFAQLLESSAAALYAAWTSGLVIAGTMVLAPLGTARHATRTSSETGAPFLVSSTVIAAALLLLRISTAHDHAGLLLALAWSLMELGLAVGFSATARRYRHAWRQHVLDAETWSAQARAVEVAGWWSARCQARVVEVEAQSNLTSASRAGVVPLSALQPR